MQEESLEQQVAALQQRVAALEQIHRRQRIMKFIMIGVVVVYVIVMAILYYNVISSFSTI